MMKKAIAIIVAFVLIIQAGAITVFAENAQENEQAIIISDIQFSPEEEPDSSSTIIRTIGLPSGSIEIVSEEWSCPKEIVISGSDIEVMGGKYSYKLTLRANRTLTFENNLEIYYQGINGKFQLNYEIEETDNHIMTVTGTFENIIIESPLMDKLSDRSKNWIISHIKNDSYFYQLLLRTAEGFSFTNCLQFLFDSKLLGYSLDYAYDLQTDEHSLVINGIGDCSEKEPEDQASEQTNDQEVIDVGMQPNDLFILNDVDGDGEATIFDVTCVQRYIANLDVPENFNTAAADADEDGEVTSIDITWIQRGLARLYLD